jgi:hypothetical protein
MIGNSTLASLPKLRAYRSMRSSSWDRTGGNRDFVTLKPGEKATMLESSNPGCVKHIWCTIGGGGPQFLRRIVLRMWWDGEASPSVEAPIGDFFGVGFFKARNFVSLPLQASPQDGRGMNCWWPMPFNSARIEVLSESDEDCSLYYYVDYEEYSRDHGEDVARFHCQWRRENPTKGWCTEKLTQENIWDVWGRKPNLDGADNYVILEAQGTGVYCGCAMHVDCFERQANDWYGEGDDMIFVDGEPWPPRLHGTGTEDYFNMAFCPQTEYSAPYHGLTLYSGNSEWPWKGKNSMYRFHIEDPIRFEKSILVTVEHGSSNKLSNDYASSAYWYQIEPHAEFPKLLPAEARLTRPDE